MKRNNHRPTPFQTKVYEATSCIPHGKVATYGWVARKIGCKSAQAVGRALRVNSFAPKVPCHRVVSADGSLHGFAGHTSGPLIAKSGDSCKKKESSLMLAKGSYKAKSFGHDANQLQYFRPSTIHRPRFSQSRSNRRHATSTDRCQSAV